MLEFSSTVLSALSLYLMSPADWIIICWFQATPTLLSSFGSSLMCNSLLSPDSDLRALVIGGEQCPSGSVLRSWKANGNKTRLINIYGVTEVSCWATWYEITADDLQLSQFASSYSFFSFINKYVDSSSVPWHCHCWLGVRKSSWPVKIELYVAVMLIYPERGADSDSSLNGI